MEGCSNVGLDKSSASESDEALKTLHKEHNVPIVYVFPHRNYLTFSVCPVEVGVNVAQVGLISPLYCILRQEVGSRVYFRRDVGVGRGG